MRATLRNRRLIRFSENRNVVSITNLENRAGMKQILTQIGAVENLDLEEAAEFANNPEESRPAYPFGTRDPVTPSRKRKAENEALMMFMVVKEQLKQQILTTELMFYPLQIQIFSQCHKE